jgi:hypothetical protein
VKAKVRRMLEVHSDMIHKVGFDATTPGVDRGYMVIQFAINFKVYGYVDVAWSDYLQFLNAPSIGSAFNLLIRDKYKGEPLAPKDTHLVEPSALSERETFVVSRDSAVNHGGDLPFLDVMGVDLAARARRKK